MLPKPAFSRMLPICLRMAARPDPKPDSLLTLAQQQREAGPLIDAHRWRRQHRHAKVLLRIARLQQVAQITPACTMQGLAQWLHIAGVASLYLNAAQLRRVSVARLA